jgi:hypothetical protein
MVKLLTGTYVATLPVATGTYTPTLPLVTGVYAPVLPTVTAVKHPHASFHLIQRRFAERACSLRQS